MVEQTLLKEWDLERSVEKIRENRFRYTYDLGAVDFVFLKDKNSFFEMHNEIWCENKIEFFLAIFENGEICICDSKTRPDKEYPMEAVIDSFTYRENTPKARKYYHLFKRENIETGECITEVQTLFTKKKPRVTVDEDLMKTMGLCRNKIAALVKKDEKGLVQKLIDRCLFIRLLEDRTGINNLKSVLNCKKFDELLDLFDFYSETFGSIFEKGDIPRNINNEVMRELQYVFGDSDFPDCCTVSYSFKDIPVSVITSIYEKFLSKEEKRTFIPENVVEYTVDKILEDSHVVNKINEGEIKVLDLVCGSGAFLVTFLEKIIKKKEKDRKLSLKEKVHILENCLYGIDESHDAIRATALSLYLKIIEDETPETIENLLTDKNLFFGLKTNLLHGNPCDNLFYGEKFDIIGGNLLQHRLFSGKEGINKQNTPYHSQLLLYIEKWMEKGALSGIVTPLPWFTQRKFEKFRKDFMEKYSLKSFTNLSRMGITHKGEPACIVFFTNIPGTMITFCTPDRSYFSEVTGIITDDNTCEVPAITLKETDNLWHIYALGYHEYVRVLTYLDRHKCNYFEDFLKGDQLHPCVCREEVTKTYEASSEVAEDYSTELDSTHPSIGKEKQEYTYEDTEPDYTDSLKKKLIIPKTWPIKAFIDSAAHDTNSWSYTLKDNYPEEYLLLFETVLNSRLAHFYLEVKYRLGEEDYPGIRLQHISHFPVPDLEFNHNVVNDIVKIVKSLKSPDSCRSHYKKLQNDLDELIFMLYDLIYYDRKEVEQYYIEKEKDTIVKKEDIKRYCEEFIDTFNPFIKEEFFLNPEWGMSEFFGTMVRFSVSEEENPLQYNKELERFFHIIEIQKIEYEKKDIFREKKIKFYDNNELYIYKSNKMKDWTEFKAMKDANEELHEYFRKLEEE